MSENQSRFPRVTTGAIISAMLTCAVPPLAYADPPPWALGGQDWRQQREPSYVGYTGKRWMDDYGVLRGSCNREALGAAAVAAVGGAVAGGAAGSPIGGDDGRGVAIILGPVFGALAGAQTGGDMDSADRACFGHVLELAKDSQPVSWHNPDKNITYMVIPMPGFASRNTQCRDYTARITANGRSETVSGKACQNRAGVWEALR